jgi:hypothetical protein
MIDIQRHAEERFGSVTVAAPGIGVVAYLPAKLRGNVGARYRSRAHFFERGQAAATPLEEHGDVGFLQGEKIGGA